MSRILLALAAAALSTACIGSTEPPPEIDYGIINIVTTPGTSGAFSTAPVGLFVRGNFSIPNTSARDACQLLPYAAGGTVSGLNYIDAGSEIALRLSGTDATLVKKTDQGVTTYVLPVPGSSIAFTPGDTAFLTVPGATGGFASSEIAVRTAEPFTFEPVPVGVDADDVPLQWSAAPHPNSVMVFSLRYARAPSAIQNEQIYCEVVDDGAFTIPGDVAIEWQTSTTKLRSAATTRYRATLKQVGSDVLHAASVFNLSPAVP
jgi:hypothetical protein